MWGGFCLRDNDDTELDNSAPLSPEVGRRSTSYRGVAGMVEANFRGPVLPAKAESRGNIRGRGMQQRVGDTVIMRGHVGGVQCNPAFAVHIEEVSHGKCGIE